MPLFCIYLIILSVLVLITYLPILRASKRALQRYAGLVLSIGLGLGFVLSNPHNTFLLWAVFIASVFVFLPFWARAFVGSYPLYAKTVRGK